MALAGAARRAAVIVNALGHRPEARAIWRKKQTDTDVVWERLGFIPFALDRARPASGPIPDIGDVERLVRDEPKLWSGRVDWSGPRKTA